MPLPKQSLAIVALMAALGGCATAPPALPESGVVRYHRIPWDDAYPSDAVVDSEGRLWFTDRLSHAIGMFDPVTDTFRRLPTPTDSSVPYGLTR